MNIRKGIDGIYWIPRNCVEIEKELDQTHNRIGKELRWRPKINSKDFLSIPPLLFEGGCYIVGKGPSITKLNKESFSEDWPIICINESIHVIEELGLHNMVFCIQQDATLGNACKPKEAALICTHDCINHYDDYLNIYCLSPESVNSHNEWSVILLVKALIKIGFTQTAIMYGFDSLTNEDTSYPDLVTFKFKETKRPEAMKEQLVLLNKLDFNYELRHDFSKQI